jgi:LemA protein
MQQLQEEIVSTENKLTFAKKAFNNAIESYNVKLKSIPDMLVPAIASSLKQDFEYWSLNEEEIKQAEDRRVEF